MIPIYRSASVNNFVTNCYPDSSKEPNWIKYNIDHVKKQYENELNRADDPSKKENIKRKIKLVLKIESFRGLLLERGLFMAFGWDEGGVLLLGIFPRPESGITLDGSISENESFYYPPEVACVKAEYIDKREEEFTEEEIEDFVVRVRSEIVL